MHFSCPGCWQCLHCPCWQSIYEKKTDLRQIHTHTYTHQFRVGRIGESRVKGQRRKRERGEERERGKNIKGREGEGGEGAKDWKGAGRGWEIDSEERQEKAVSIFFFFLHNA